eukprot:gene20158-26892_t
MLTHAKIQHGGLLHHTKSSAKALPARPFPCRPNPLGLPPIAPPAYRTLDSAGARTACCALPVPSLSAGLLAATLAFLPVTGCDQGGFYSTGVPEGGSNRCIKIYQPAAAAEARLKATISGAGQQDDVTLAAASKVVQQLDLDVWHCFTVMSGTQPVERDQALVHDALEGGDAEPDTDAGAELAGTASASNNSIEQGGLVQPAYETSVADDALANDADRGGSGVAQGGSVQPAYETSVADDALANDADVDFERLYRRKGSPSATMGVDAFIQAAQAARSGGGGGGGGSEDGRKVEVDNAAAVLSKETKQFLRDQLEAERAARTRELAEAMNGME